MESLLNEILEDLGNELELSEGDSKIAALTSKIRNAIREVRLKRNYPEHFTEEQAVKDLQKHYSNIRELALYDFNQVGAEGQTSHNENGTNRTWKSRNDCLIGVFAYCG
ncbi:MAG: hypothetical protein HDQ97_00010 [Lachnospiraceae bacterium]|nr:hypothetical protein [Lachnospiraceae bacterium]